MFIEPLVLKATKEMDEYGQIEPKIENLKTYVVSNNFKQGTGPEAWRSNTRIARQELYGPWTQSLNNDKDVVEPEEEELEPGL